jgi:hypothetical protein
VRLIFCSTITLGGAIAKTAYFPMSAILVFAAACDLSAALTELHVAIYLRLVHAGK